MELAVSARTAGAAGLRWEDVVRGGPREGRMDERWASGSGRGRGYNRNFMALPTSVNVTPEWILIMWVPLESVRGRKARPRTCSTTHTVSESEVTDIPLSGPDPS